MARFSLPPLPCLSLTLSTFSPLLCLSSPGTQFFDLVNLAFLQSSLPSYPSLGPFFFQYDPPPLAKLCIVQCQPPGLHTKVTEYLETTADWPCTAMVPKATGLCGCPATLSWLYNLLAVPSLQKTLQTSLTLFCLLPPLSSLTAMY